MLIKEKELNSIKQNKVTLVKNFITLEKKYDFNLISNLIEENELIVFSKTTYGNLKDVFQILKVSNFFKEFKVFFDFFRKLLKYEIDSRDEVDLFFSFASQVGGSHVDLEDVFIIGLKGKTIYRIFGKENKDYEVKEGDLIYIPNGIKHKVIGMNPRIIASIGFYGKRIN
jgi:ribosomal protein L16 Arg81 hydroxylase|tara:strand:+ start:903 stop:1412 length:510 start_codon:yes stop_codon:yes gene_type:complete